ncbi:MAG: tyrosine-type recombinase/integrase [Isosphaeraceae bacterium]|nr:tyrosine-type recombinase/integrase [Isosphaeraceae bacterium]
MAKKATGRATHTGKTDSGHTRDQKIERLGPITIYKRGLSYYLYYREDGATVRQKIDGNLAVARATAAKVAGALADGRPSPLGYQSTAPHAMVEAYLNSVATVQNLALRTQDRYRAALQRFLDFCEVADLTALDAVNEETIEEFVRWLRQQTRTRNGASKGKRAAYKLGGVKFILSTCRTAFHWARKRRMLPPYSDNPFTAFPIEKLRERDQDEGAKQVFSPDQERQFFDACSGWQRDIFVVLTTYGLRVGELTHLLIEDVDFQSGAIEIRSKAELFWSVKTGRRRQLPLIPATRTILERLIGDRRAGFVFLNEDFFTGKAQPVASFGNPAAFRGKLRQVVEELVVHQPNASERDKRRATTAYCRKMGQIPEKRIRNEFIEIAAAIGCPEYTKAHDLRHLFASRAQEAGTNPLLVQEMLGHTTLDMTRRYTHVGLDAKREALSKVSPPNAPPTSKP